MHIVKDNFLTTEARKGKARNNKCYLDIIYCIMVYSVAVLIQYIIMIIPTVYYYFNNEMFVQALESGGIASAFSSDVLEEVTNTMPIGYDIWLLFSNISLVIVVIMYCRLFEKRNYNSIGFYKKRWGLEYFLGYIIGIVLITAALSIGVLSNSMEFTEPSSGFSFIALVFLFAAYVVQGLAEELLCRGFLMVSISKCNKLWLAVIINALIFALLHSFNPGVTILAIFNLFLFGVFISIYMIKRKSIWGAAAIHASWNFVQGNIFGVQVSGLDAKNSVFSVQSEHGASLISGGAFGLEGGIAVTVVLLVAIIVTLLFKERKINICNI